MITPYTNDDILNIDLADMKNYIDFHLSEYIHSAIIFHQMCIGMNILIFSTGHFRKTVHACGWICHDKADCLYYNDELCFLIWLREQLNLALIAL